MGKKVRSARGIEVDFDLLKIKQQIAESPNVNVTPRTEFVEKRLRRRTKRSVVPAPVAKVDVPADPVDVELIDDFVEDAAPEQAEQVRPVRKVNK